MKEILLKILSDREVVSNLTVTIVVSLVILSFATIFISYNLIWAIQSCYLA